MARHVQERGWLVESIAGYPNRSAQKAYRKCISMPGRSAPSAYRHLPAAHEGEIEMNWKILACTRTPSGSKVNTPNVRLTEADVLPRRTVLRGALAAGCSLLVPAALLGCDSRKETGAAAPDRAPPTPESAARPARRPIWNQPLRRVRQKFHRQACNTRLSRRASRSVPLACTSLPSRTPANWSKARSVPRGGAPFGPKQLESWLTAGHAGCSRFVLA